LSPDVSAALTASRLLAAERTSEMSFDNYFTRQYNPEDSSEHLITALLNNVSKVGGLVL
jgi:hypothetical protein